MRPGSALAADRGNGAQVSSKGYGACCLGGGDTCRQASAISTIRKLEIGANDFSMQERGWRGRVRRVLIARSADDISLALVNLARGTEHLSYGACGDFDVEQRWKVTGHDGRVSAAQHALCHPIGDHGVVDDGHLIGRCHHPMEPLWSPDRVGRNDLYGVLLARCRDGHARLVSLRCMTGKVLMPQFVTTNQRDDLIDGLLLGSAHPRPGGTSHVDLRLLCARRWLEPDSDNEGARCLWIAPDRCHNRHETWDRVADEARWRIGRLTSRFPPCTVGFPVAAARVLDHSDWLDLRVVPVGGRRRPQAEVQVARHRDGRIKACCNVLVDQIWAGHELSISWHESSMRQRVTFRTLPPSEIRRGQG